MLTRYNHRDIVWVDLESPTPDEVRSLMDEFAIAPAVAEELLAPSLHPCIEEFSNYAYVVLHFPAARHSHTTSAEQEIDFVVGERFIITTHYDVVDPLHTFSKLFEVHALLDRDGVEASGGELFLTMLEKLYEGVSNELDYLESRLAEVENNIFEGREQQMVRGLSDIGRDLLNFKRALIAHRDNIVSLDNVVSKLFGDTLVPRARTVIADYFRIHTKLQTHTESLRELRETNSALLSTKQNQIMKNLTIVAATLYPMTLIVGLFGMNTEFTPLVGQAYDFWMVIGLVSIATGLLFLYFKGKKWL